MAKRRKARKKKQRISFSFRPSGKLKRKKAHRQPQNGRKLLSILKILAVACILAAVGLFLVFLDRYVRTEVPIDKKVGVLRLANAPGWITDELKEKILTAAAAGGEDFKLDTDAARSVAENLADVAWLDNPRVQVTHDALLIDARYRKPIGFVKSALQKFYIDSELVVLDFLPMPKLPVVEIKAASGIRIPPTGSGWQRADLAAAAAVLALLGEMDRRNTPQKPLLYQIESIDVSNLDGRRRPRDPHIVLYAEDGTQINWGAKPGSSQRYMEAPEAEKLATLYGFYKDHGTCQGLVKYIELRVPRKSVPQPIDKY